MKKQLLTLSAVCLLLIASCSKSNDAPKQPDTPLHKLIDSKYIGFSGDGPTGLTVDYNAYKNGGDLDQALINAAQQTVNPPYNYKSIRVDGANLITTFKNDNQPITYKFNPRSQYAGDLKVLRPWKGKIIITKTNKLISQVDFDKGVNIQLNSGTSGDQVTLLSRTVTEDVIIGTFDVKSNKPETIYVYFTVQSNVDVSIRVEYEMDLGLYGFQKIQFANSTGGIPPKITNIGNNTQQYVREIFQSYVRDSLEEFLTRWYMQTHVAPKL